MFFIAIIGDRKRSEDGTDAQVIRKLIEDEIPKPGPMPVFVSVGCDMGIGKLVKTICEEHALPFCELSCIFHDFNTALRRGAHVDAYLARNLSIYHLCQMFHLFVRDSRQGIIENLVGLLDANPKEYAVVIYDENNTIVETMGFPQEDTDEQETEGQGTAIAVSEEASASESDSVNQASDGG